MMTKALLLLVLSLGISSCVSPKIHKDLQNKYDKLKLDLQNLNNDNEDVSKVKNTLENDLEKLQEAFNNAEEERQSYKRKYDAAQNNLKTLKASYEALEKNSSSSIAKNSKKNRELLAQLEAKEQALYEEQKRLDALRDELEHKAQRTVELEKMIAEKDRSMKALKNTISKALTNFEGKGLTVEQRDGKVYVSMENKLLFNSGSWAVGSNGRQAIIELGKVLADSPEVSVLIEGHTDNDAYAGLGPLKDNWDLSTKRATAIVTILRENSGINPENLTAAGRGEYAPIASNETAEGKAKNRRIEVILTPKLDEISKLLHD